MFRSFAALVVFFCTSTVAFGSDVERTNAITDLFDWETRHVEAEDRVQFSLALFEYWRHFDERLPELSPAENAWLEEELESLQQERVNRATQTGEFAISWLNRLTEYCMHHLQRTIDTNGEDHEMFFWLQSLSCFKEHDRINSYLEYLGLSDGRYDGPFNLLALDATHDYIVKYVTPSAMSETMDWMD